MEKYINPTERVANKLYDYIKNTDKGKEKSKGSYKKGKKIEMSHIKKKKMFQYNNYNSPINNLELIDIKIAIRYGEDEIYCNDDDVFNNIRRGDCLTYNKETKKYGIGRIGLIKFFDYKKKYNQNEISLEKRVLDKVKQSNLPLIAYLTEKANGENFQVSFNNEFQCWIIGSKNVSLAARDEKDLDYYNKNNENNRYNYTLNFAKLWFELLNNNIKDKIEEFKKEMGDHTLIGENVGDLLYQHIKTYNKRDVIFYGIVNNSMYDNEICLPLNKSFKIFKKYNLSYVPNEVSPIYDNFSKLKLYLDEKYDEILLRNLENGGEGCVVYIAEVDENGNENVLTLGKLKTFEYRFYRKIREKCKQLRYKNKKSTNYLKNSLRKESEEIIEHLKDKINFDDYMNFGDFIIDYNEFDNRDFSNVFANFIEEMKKMYEKKEEFNNIKKDFDKKFNYYFHNYNENESDEENEKDEKKDNEKEDEKEFLSQKRNK